MDEQQSPKIKTRSKTARVLRIVFRVVLILILIVSLLALSVLTPPVQDFIRGKATSWLSNKLKTKVAIGKIYIGFPKKVVVDGVYIEDRSHDTLLYSGELKVDIALMKLLHSEVEVSQVSLADLTAKVRRTLPDTVFNFQFIIDAFASKEPSTPSTDTSSMKITVKDIDLDRIRLLYKDDVTGNDVAFNLAHFNTGFDVFDLNAMKFRIPETNISGIYARVHQHKPLRTAMESAAADTAASALPDISFSKFNLANVDLEYGDDVSALSTKLNLASFKAEAQLVDLAHQNIVLRELSLQGTTATVRMGKQSGTAAAAQKSDSAAPAAEGAGWHVLVKNISFDKNNIAFDNDNSAPVKSGMDYMHLNIKDFTLHAANLLYTSDTMSASVTKGSMREKSGFQLNTLQTDFLYTSNQAYLHNLLIETPGTLLKRSAGMKYASLEAVQKDIGKLALDVDVAGSRVQVKDILTFAPFLGSQPAFSNPDATFYVDGRITGKVNDMKIGRLKVRALNNTNVDMSGTIAGLPDAKKVAGNLTIRSLNTTRRDIALLAPKGSIPNTLAIPESIGLNGTIRGNMQTATADLNMHSSSGNASVKGDLANATDSVNAKYDVTMRLDGLDLGKLLKNDTLYGPVTAAIHAKGQGYAMKTADASADGTINSVTLNRYTYKNIGLQGSIRHQLAQFAAQIADPNLSFHIKGNSDLSKPSPSIALNATLDSIKTKPLRFTTDTIEYRGNIVADFPNTDVRNLEGKLTVTQSKLVMGLQHYNLDTMTLQAGKSDTGQFLRLNADAITLALTGKYNLAQLGSVFQQAIQPYYAIIPPTAKKDTLDDYDFYVKAQATDGPLLRGFVPSLTRMEPIQLDGHFATGKGFNMRMAAPILVMGTTSIRDVKMNAETRNNAINLRTEFAEFSAGPSMSVYATRLNAKLADNKINFLLNLKDADNKDKYRLGGLVSQPAPQEYTLSLSPDSLMLNYDKWTIAENNLLKFDSLDLNVANFSISSKGQVLTLNSISQQRNSPLEVKFDKFRIGTLTAFAKQDSLLADGTIDGQVLLKNIMQQPVFTSDLTITDLTFRKDTVGNLSMKVNNQQENTYTADITLTGKGNEVAINGNYIVKPANQSVIDLHLDLRKLQMKSVEAFSFGALANSRGYVNGKLDIAGTFDKPNANGKFDFHEAGFTPTALGSYFTIDKQTVFVDDEGVNWDHFTIEDSAKNKLVLDGNAYTTNFVNYKFDMGLSATNFEALNSSKSRTKLYYGKFYFDTDLSITGTEAAPVIDGDLTVNDNTDLTIVMPEDQPGVVEREGIVRFIDVDSVHRDTTLLLAKDTVGKTGFSGMDLSVNIEIKKAAQLTLVVDEANGDFLKMQGHAQLTGGIDPSGKTTLAGTYEIDKGQYNLSFNFVKRQFDIKQGSKITWLGSPTKANIDLTAIYVANTAPETLVQTMQANTPDATYKQKLPFQVDLILQGELMKPAIKFDVTLPQDQNFNVSSTLLDNVQAKLGDLRSQPDELNKQVFALLLLNRFVAENPFASSGGGGGLGTTARQSVSKILSDQLNNLATDLIKGVDLNFDLASNEDYTTKDMQNRTDLNVSLSKQLLSDRLKVTVGSNFELEGPQQSNEKSNNLAGNVALDYMLSKDGRYVARAYRKNQYEGELDGYVIETGLTFIIRFDYDQFRELFHSPRQQKRPQRKKNREEESTQKSKKGPGTENASAIND